MNTLRIGGLAAALLAAGALVAGCGSSSDTASSTSAAADTMSTSQKVGGMAKCDQASLAKAVEATGTAKEPATLVSATSFKCSDGWAYAYINSGTGDTAYEATLVFEAEGQFWIPKDRAKVCKAPGDQVPAAIYQQACETN